MPFAMDCYVQSVVVQGSVYVGGGHAGFTSPDNYVVMEYDISSGRWTKLPPYGAYNFAMTVINNQLVLVGGLKSGFLHSSKVLGVWRAWSQEWMQFFSEMPTGRSSCSAVVYNEWLVVAGGWDGRVSLSSVDVMNTDTKQWFAGPPTPTPWSSMRTASCGGTCYLMGGSTAESLRYTTEVYSVSLPVLISQLCSLESRGEHKQQLNQMWKEIPRLQTVCSSPITVSGSLLAVGGLEKNHEVTTIQLYHPDTEEWVKVGDLPTPRRNCTCAMISEREMIVAGGESGSGTSRLDFVLIV